MTDLSLSPNGKVSSAMSSQNSDTAMVKLLHTSDLHIGVEHYHEEALFGLQAIVDLAIELKVDALLIAGDLFDHEDLDRSLVGYVFELLGSIGVPVVVLPGNHDGLILDQAFGGISIPDTVRLILLPDGGMISLPQIDVSIWGRPVYDHSPSFSPLSRPPARPSARWYVVMAHGLVVLDNNPQNRSSPITADELAGISADYVALGHAHGFRDVSAGDTQAYYCGAPSGTDTPTAALITLNPEGGAGVEKIRLPLRRTNEPTPDRMGFFRSRNEEI